MKTLKKILLTVLVLVVLSPIIGYCYFDKKFTPEKNYLSIKNESGKVFIKWEEDKKSILIPIKIIGDSTTYYMQFDTGSPYTVFYKKSIENVSNIKYKIRNKTSKTTFEIGGSQISSDKFKTLNHGEQIRINDTVKLIGTIGTDIIENNKTVINFKENYVSLNLNKTPQNFTNKLSDFEFKKRKIIINGTLNGSAEKFLYDSGTSAYELLTNKEVWENLKLPNSKIEIEKGKSWENVLTTHTAKCNNKISFQNSEIPLNNVTYVEGFSKTQYWLMKLSGMTGMLGNKTFLKHSIFIDGKEKKIGFE